MGWSGGSSMCESIIRLLRKHVPEASRPKVYDGLIDLFESEDCDTLCEVDDPEFQKRLRKKHPGWYSDDE